MALERLPSLIREKYEVYEWKHASAILRADFPSEWKDIIDLLKQFKFCKSWITVGGGRKTKVAEAIDTFLFNRGWVEKEFSKSKHRLRQWIA